MLDSLIAEKLDTAATFIYLDPPYLRSTRKYKRNIYLHEMDEKQHRDLLSKISAIRGSRVMVSHYPNSLYDEALKGWNTHGFYSIIRNGMALERLCFNYDITDQLHDYRVLGGDFRERERNNRIIKNMAAKLQRLEPALRNAVIERILNSH